jgi:hypothetical protein
VPQTPATAIDPSHERPRATVRRATTADLALLVELEQATFEHDRLDARQWRRHLHSDSAVVLVATRGRVLAGAAVLFFRSGSQVALKCRQNSSLRRNMLSGLLHQSSPSKIRA